MSATIAVLSLQCSFIYQVLHLSVLHFQRRANVCVCVCVCACGACVCVGTNVVNNIAPADVTRRLRHTRYVINSECAVLDRAWLLRCASVERCDAGLGDNSRSATDLCRLSYTGLDRANSRAERHTDTHGETEPVIIRTRPRHTTCSRRVSCVLRSSEGTQTPR